MDLVVKHIRAFVVPEKQEAVVMRQTVVLY